MSFERNHRIWLYAADDSPPRPTPIPTPTSRPTGHGGTDGLSSSRTRFLSRRERRWHRLALQPCWDVRRRPSGLVPTGFGLTALAACGSADSRCSHAPTTRASGLRVSRQVDRRNGSARRTRAGRNEVSGAFHRRQFRGIAVVPRSPDGIRLYLISDDNGSTAQRARTPRVRLAAAQPMT